jgi:hypothetical protein
MAARPAAGPADRVVLGGGPKGVVPLRNLDLINVKSS